MPAPVDHEERRRAASEAVWQVLAGRGFGGLTMRAVAERMGATTGLITHYFPSKRALVRHALDVAEERTAGRPRQEATGEGLPALRAALLDVLPVSPDLVAMSRVWVSFWDGALGDAELGRRQTARYVRWRAMLQPHVKAAQRSGQLPADTPADDLVAMAAAFAHGLVVQALFDRRRFPRDRQVRLLDEFLGALSRR